MVAGAALRAGNAESQRSRQSQILRVEPLRSFRAIEVRANSSPAELIASRRLSQSLSNIFIVTVADLIRQMFSKKLLVDIHTHVYLPRYATFLRSRTAVPRIFSRTDDTGRSEERLLILDNEPSGGRPVGAQVSRFIGRNRKQILTQMLSVLGQRRKAQVHGQTWDRHLSSQVMAGTSFLVTPLISPVTIAQPIRG